ncbi:hypothetical protein PGIGA_G00172210, partial [Pangasianodon gigas]|nr:hypothetical protein [Pangasianodon gigas]
THSSAHTLSCTHTLAHTPWPEHYSARRSLWNRQTKVPDLHRWTGTRLEHRNIANARRKERCVGCCSLFLGAVDSSLRVFDRLCVTLALIGCQFVKYPKRGVTTHPETPPKCVCVCVCV